MEPESCPNADDLRKFVRCSVTEQQAESIAEHLEVCPSCEETVVGLERDGDTIADHIRKAAAEPTFSHEPECQQIMASLLEQTALGGTPAPPTGLESPMAQSLRDYQIIAMLGEGGMGAVYKAVHQRLKKTVALKVLPTNRIGDQPAVARFEREMSVLGQLNHPNIVQALDAGEHDGQHYLVMEYVEGRDLSDIVKHCSPLSIADACQLISQAATGLQYAHEHGFVHRDIKPSNLMLATTERRNGEAQAIVKVLDLGLARALDQPTDPANAKADLTTTGQVMGTLDYMAPEQGGDAHQVDIRADIYSLGATLYKLLTGDSPYAEHAQKPPLQRLMAIAQHEPPAIRTKRPDVPEKLAVIVHRMLSKKPENRYATPAEVTQALEPFCTGANLAALLVPQGATRIFDSQSLATTPLKPSNTGRNTGRRWRTALSGFAAFLLLAVIIQITTRNGTVEVSSPDGKLPDDVTVAVSRGGEEIELLQADNQWSAKVVNGEYQVQLRGGDDRFEIKDSKLIVTRMGKVLVTVHTRSSGMPPADIPGKANDVSAPDRRAAEWVLSIGGTITISGRYEESSPATIAELPTKHFQLVDVRLLWLPQIDDKGMSAFKGCRSVRNFEAIHHIGDTGVAYLQESADLRHLSLLATKVTDAGLAAFKQCKNLEYLELDGTKVGGDGLVHFRECSNLTHLGLGWTHVVDTDLTHFNNCTKLTSLWLHNTKVTDAVLSHVKDHTNLREIRLESTSVTDAGIELLANCKKLVSVNVTSSRVTERGVRQLAAAVPQCRITWDGGVIEPQGRASAQPVNDKPFSIERGGQKLKSFMSLVAAYDESQSGDILLVEGDGRIEVKFPNVTKPLHLKTVDGHRPLLVLTNGTDTVPPLAHIQVQSDFTMEGCDVDARPSQFLVRTQGKLTWRACRVWGGATDVGRAHISDSILVGHKFTAGQFDPGASELVLENCATGGVAQRLLLVAGGTCDFRMKHCTYFNRSGMLLTVPEGSSVNMEATGNLFDSDTGVIVAAGERAAWHNMEGYQRVNWTGTGNCFAGRWFTEYELDEKQQAVEKAKGLEAWNRRWKLPEKDSREIPSLALEFGRVQKLPAPGRTSELAKIIDSLRKQHQIEKTGPDMSLIGPGDAYVRALAAAGRPVSENDLRPERPEAGPVLLLRKGLLIKAYEQLPMAIEDAQDGDILELRTDGTLDGGIGVGKGRHLTVRSAPGYRPVVNGLGSQSDLFRLEGLLVRASVQVSGSMMRFTDSNQPFTHSGGFERIQNCSIEGAESGGGLSGWLYPTEGPVPVIENCDLWDISLAVPPKSTATISNSILRFMWLSTAGTADRSDSIAFDHCLVWATMRGVPGAAGPMMARGTGRVRWDQSLIVSDYPLIDGHNLSRRPLAEFAGEQNAFVCPDSGSGLRFEAFRQHHGIPLNGLELPPLEFDPAQWRIHREMSPGYEPRPDQTDYGMDLKRLAKAITVPLR